MIINLCLLHLIKNVQRHNATKLLLNNENNKPTIQGWLTKVRNGHAKRCWCVLVGKTFLYFKSSTDTVNTINIVTIKSFV